MDSEHRIPPWVPRSIVGFPSRQIATPNIVESPRFGGFGKLPFNLRRKIWLYGFPAPQTIPLSLNVRETPDDGQRTVEWTQHPCLLPTFNPPPLLFVNHEACGIVLEHYHKLSISSTPEVVHSRRSKAKYIYFNYATDAFAILFEHLQHLFHSVAGNLYMLDPQFTQLFPNIPMNIKRFSTVQTTVYCHIEMRGDPPEFPHTERDQQIQNWFYIGAKLKRIKDNYSHGYAVWKSPLPLRFKGFCHAGIDVHEEVFIQLTPSTQSKFHPFPNLPFELRRQIWKYLLPPPAHHQLSLHPSKSVDARIIIQTLHSTTSDPNRAQPFEYLNLWPDPRFDPTLLLISKESHSIFLEFYTWIPLQSVHVPGSHPGEAGVYFDESRDCFLVRKRNMWFTKGYFMGLEDPFTGLLLSVMKIKTREFVRACVLGRYRVFAAAEGEGRGDNLLEGVDEREWKEGDGLGE